MLELYKKWFEIVVVLLGVIYGLVLWKSKMLNKEFLYVVMFVLKLGEIVGIIWILE